MLNIVYLGTPQFAICPLEKILELDGVKVVGVITNLDKPVGRKQILTPPPVKSFALEKGIPVFQYAKIRKEGISDLLNLKPDLMITCAFGQILSQEILDIPKFGTFNIHGSILPKYRGASPIQYSVLNGDKTSGITIMKTDVGVDTGDIIYQKEVEILENETSGELMDRLSVVGADCICKVLNDLKNNNISYTPQDNDKATFTKMLTKENAVIDFSDSAQNICNKIRAYNPSPIAYTFLNGEPFKIYSALPVDVEFNVPFGQVVDCNKKLIVACGKGAISLQTVQKSGGKCMDIKSFLAGNKLCVGDKLGL